MRYVLEGIVSFSTRPLHLVTSLGLCSSVAALVYALALVGKTLVMGIDVPGYASITAFVLLFGSAQLLSIGIMGEYLSRLYEQEKHRPIYLTRRTINVTEGSHED